MNSTNVTFKNCIWENFGGGGATAGHHWETMWLSGVASPVMENCVFHNVFKGSDGNQPSGWNMWGYTKDARINGNLFFVTTGATQNGQGVGQGEGVLFTFDSHQLANTNMVIANNTFANMGELGFLTIGLNADTIGGQNLSFVNNIIQGTTQLRFTTENLATPWTVAYNWRSSAMFPCFRCIADSTSGQIDFTTTNWINMSAANFRLAVNSTPGTDLGSAYTPDLYGVPRATWSRGAYQYAADPPIHVVGKVTLRGAVNLRVGN
jgi:hypothetical protein